MNIPKTLPCKDCGIKPKREVIGWGYSDKDDEFFLVHKCKAGHVRFPEKGTFSEFRFEFQEPKVVEAWNQKQGETGK